MVLETKQEADPLMVIEAKLLEHSIREKLKTFDEVRKKFQKLTEEPLNLNYFSTKEAIIFLRKLEDFTRNLSPMLDSYKKLIENKEKK